MNSKYFNEEVDRFIINNYLCMTSNEIAERLKIPSQAIRYRASKLGIKKFNRIDWNECIIEKLYQEYPNIGAKKFSEIYNIPVTAVEKKASSLGIKYEFKMYHINSQGYKVLHMNGDKIYEHRYVMEQYIGRKLTSEEIVHHLDEDKLNNNIENLEITTRELQCKAHHHQD